MRVLLGVLLLTAALTGCIGSDETDDDAPADEPVETQSVDDATMDAGGNETATDPPEPPAPEPNASDPAPPAETPAPPKLTPPRPFALTATGCKELLVQVPVDLASAQVFVPANYTIVLNEAGLALAFAGLKVCPDTRIDDVPIGPASTGDIGVVIEAPDGSDGLHYYQTWWITNNLGLYDRLTRMGWNASAVGGTVLSDGRLEGLAGDLNVVVPWEEGTYEASTTAATIPAGPPMHAVGWQDTPFGRVKVDKTFAIGQFGLAPGILSADEGSPVARLMGGSESVGVAMVASYAMTGTVTLVEG